MAYDKPNLNNNQKKFCEEYARCGNATQSAIAAGYSIKSAGYTGSILLKNPKVQTYLDIVRKENTKSTQKSLGIMSAEEVLERLSHIARGEAREEFFSKSGKVLTRQADLTAQNRALELLGRTHALFSDKVQYDKIDMGWFRDLNNEGPEEVGEFPAGTEDDTEVKIAEAMAELEQEDKEKAKEESELENAKASQRAV